MYNLGSPYGYENPIPSGVIGDGQPKNNDMMYSTNE